MLLAPGLSLRLVLWMACRHLEKYPLMPMEGRQSENLHQARKKDIQLKKKDNSGHTVSNLISLFSLLLLTCEIAQHDLHCLRTETFSEHSSPNGQNQLFLE